MTRLDADGPEQNTLCHAVQGEFSPCTACRLGVGVEVGVAYTLTAGAARRQAEARAP